MNPGITTEPAKNMTMNFGIRVYGEDNMCFCQFTYETDGRVMLRHLKLLHLDTKHVYQLVRLIDGQIIANTDDPF